MVSFNKVKAISHRSLGVAAFAVALVGALSSQQHNSVVAVSFRPNEQLAGNNSTVSKLRRKFEPALSSASTTPSTSRSVSPLPSQKYQAPTSFDGLYKFVHVHHDLYERHETLIQKAVDLKQTLAISHMFSATSGLSFRNSYLERLEDFLQDYKELLEKEWLGEYSGHMLPAIQQYTRDADTGKPDEENPVWKSAQESVKEIEALLIEKVYGKVFSHFIKITSALESGDETRLREVLSEPTPEAVQLPEFDTDEAVAWIQRNFEMKNQNYIWGKHAQELKPESDKISFAKQFAMDILENISV